MKLLIKQRVFSWTDSYDIYDEQGNTRYFVKADFLALGHHLRVYNQQEEEIACVHEKLLTMRPAFEIEIEGTVRGRVQKKFTFLKPKYEIDYNGWRVEGDFLGWDYDVYEGCGSIIHISKEPLHWGDTYVIDIANPAHELEALMLVIAIDAANCSES